MSKTITVETTINASLDEVWSEVSRIENHSNWMKDAVKIDFESETKSGVGTKIKVLTKIAPLHDIHHVIISIFLEYCLEF